MMAFQSLLAATTMAGPPNLSSMNQPSFFYFIFFIIFVALVFDFLNGFHDAANSHCHHCLDPRSNADRRGDVGSLFQFRGGVFSSAPRYLKPFQVIWSIRASSMLTWFWGALAIIWNITMASGIGHQFMRAWSAGWRVLGSPAGIGVVIWPGKWRGILLFIFLGPIIGFLIGGFFMVATSSIFHRSTPNRVDGWFRRLQLFSAAILQPQPRWQ